MSALPHCLSAHPTAWSTNPGPGMREEDPAHASTSCHLCGQPLRGWQEPFHLNDDHLDDSPDNVVPACPLCHLSQHLNRSTIEGEAVLIWLPKVTQRAVIMLVRAAHLALQADRVVPYATALPEREITERTKAAFATLRALRSRSLVAEQVLGSSSPRILGAALMSLPAEVYAERTTRLSGVRLLPLGRLFVESQDIYGRILASWAIPNN